MRGARARGVVGGDARAGAIESLVQWTVGRDRNMRLSGAVVCARVEMA